MLANSIGVVAPQAEDAGVRTSLEDAGVRTSLYIFKRDRLKVHTSHNHNTDSWVILAKCKRSTIRREKGMYFVDREKIEERLLFMEKQLELLKTQQHWETDLEKAALERIAHTIIEAILDTGNAMIDGFIMRDPGSYEDIVDILTDEQVITANFSDILKQVIACRKILVQQ